MGRTCHPRPPPYVPARYRPRALGSVVVWSAAATPDLDEPIAGAFDRTTALLHVPERRVHFVVYDSPEDSARVLGRQVHPAALLAPLHEPDRALVALHAPHAHPRNRDPARIDRHLCHEIAHVLVAEVTGSVKRLGDGNRGMKVAPWVDEGLAECTAALASGQHGLLERAAARSAAVAMSIDEVNAALCDLDHPDRSAAFAHATAAVWRAARQYTLPVVFQRAATPASWGFTRQ